MQSKKTVGFYFWTPQSCKSTTAPLTIRGAEIGLNLCLVYRTEEFHLFLNLVADCLCARSEEFTRVKALAF